MLKIRSKQRRKLGITHFGLLGHEVALIESMMERAPDLASDYELRDPNHAGTCEIVLVNKDSQLATSWWKNYKKRHPSAIPLFLTDSREDSGDDAFCKRPFSPSFLEAAFQGLVGERAS